MENKPRKPWVSGLLTFFVIGLGHIYSGNPKKGVILFFGGLLLTIFAYSSCLFYAPIGPIIFITILISYVIYTIIDSAKLARVYSTIYIMKDYNKWYVYIICWIIGSLFFHTSAEFAIENNLVKTYKIPSAAMKPTLTINDYIISNVFIYKLSSPKRGDIVVFEYPEDETKNYIKRIIGVGGETIEIRNKQVFINGTIYQEAYKVTNDPNIIQKEYQPRDNFGPKKIPKDSFFVMGDNRDHSFDSRFWGYVNKSKIKGKAVRIYWSWDKDSFSVRWNRIGRNIS